jgi:F-type H+-transporting ATPase subunit epsilon
MASTLQFDLVSPERRLASLQATEVQIPGAEGDMTAMADHAPTITTLRPGILKAVSAEGTLEFVVTGGFAEITPKATSVLAELARPVSEVTAEFLDGLIAEASDVAGKATPEAKADADKRVADFQTLKMSVRL